MKLIWHLVMKDLRRIRVAVGLLSLLMIGKIVFYAVVGGLLRAPDLVWLNRLQQLPELLLRVIAELLIIYVLVGWLVFEDSPVEHDAQWITRPISGRQLFAAKLTGASLVFVLLPVVLNFPWWLACGLDGAALLGASVELGLLNLFVVAMALCFAALTDGFPRFVFWSLVALAAFVLIQMILAFLLDPGSGVIFSRILVWCMSGGIVALVVAGYEFTTRRHHVALTLAVAGMLAVAVLGGAWRWNLTKSGNQALRTADAEAQRMAMEGIGVHFRRAGARQFADVDLQIASVPSGTIVTQIRALGEWSLEGKKVWSSRVKVDDAEITRGGLRRILFPGSAGSNGGPVVLSLPFSPQIAQRATVNSAVLRASVDLDLFSGAAAAELPLNGKMGSRFGKSFAISSISDRPLPEGPRSKAMKGKAPTQRAVAVVLEERTIDGILPMMRGGWSPTYFSLVNRSTGEMFFSDRVHSGPMAITTLNQVRVSCMQLVFPVELASLKLDEMALVVVRLSGGQLVSRRIDVGPIAWAEVETTAAK
ncbi:MAG: hypothetical protein ABIZ04_06120 [Opitutus sp.]